ncbi:LytR C-terminal domain-containing protein [Aeromicrobium sp. NPDC092404]|uniref:LytR C-terminal domain-containing protein n=1 Tax=Aeromicrobium sp. NPDC092404 TaxID=3154976 RepID=UPI0034247A54
MDHRRTPSGKAYVPASWFIVLTVMLCIGAAGWLGWLFVDDDPDTPVATPSPSATTPSQTPSPDPTKTTETTPSPSPEPTKTTEEPEANRDAGVSVLNNTTIQGLAATYSVKVRQAGWTDVRVGNWRGSIAGNTIYFPPQLAEQARLLGDDLDIGRILPSFAPMRTDRLTIILAGPQQ